MIRAASTHLLRPKPLQSIFLSFAITLQLVTTNRARGMVVQPLLDAALVEAVRAGKLVQTLLCGSIRLQQVGLANDAKLVV